MAKTYDAFVPSAINVSAVTIVPADTTTKKTLWTAGSEGGKVTMINSSSDDTATKDLQLWLSLSGVDYLLGTKTIPITAGFITGTPSFNWLDGIQIPSIPIDRDGQRYLFVPPSGILKVGATATVTTAKTHYITAFGLNY
jgi:hypothetical protein